MGDEGREERQRRGHRVGDRRRRGRFRYRRLCIDILLRVLDREHTSTGPLLLVSETRCEGVKCSLANGAKRLGTM